MASHLRFSGLNEAYLVEQYESYRRDPASVDPRLRQLFQDWAPSLAAPHVAQPPPAVSPSPSLVAPHVAQPPPAFPEPRRRAVSPSPSLAAALSALVRAIRDDGHLAARLDPLGLRPPPGSPSLDPAAHGLTEAALQQLPPDALESPPPREPLSAAEAVAALRDIYCSSTGYEFAHLRDPEERAWLRDAVESRRLAAPLSREAQVHLLQRLVRVEAFEEFLHRSFPGQKWFSLEGCDALVPILDELREDAGDAGIGAIVLGMPHRGRLNVLTHVLQRPYEDVMAEFVEGGYIQDSTVEDRLQGWMRDVKYHLGASASDEDEMALHLLPNPSHLELVDPVVLGAVRALQERAGPREQPGPGLQAGGSATVRALQEGDGSRGREPAGRAMALLIHGEAAFAGQGIVAETLNLSQLEGYTVGGTIHLVINNQVGFTTDLQQEHGGLYPTDVCRGFDVPVVHVNADDLPACLAAARLAFAYRSRFHKDFVIDLVGYRRFGHNEADEPSFTQPLMYDRTRSHPTARALWAQRLEQAGVVSPEEVEAMLRDARAELARARAAVEERRVAGGDRLAERLMEPRLLSTSAVDEAAPEDPETGVPLQQLERLNQQALSVPPGFALHPKLQAPMKRRRDAVAARERIDWAQAEALAFASILAEGRPVRLSGQDSERGTFSQRHAVFHDPRTGARLVPLREMPDARAPFTVINSPLSEESVLGFEYGYSVNAPDTLVLWEAQFGDFVNKAQAVIDEFVVSAQAKWGQTSGLVLLLPHGYEGQGPNHSSAHLERTLQLAAGENVQVAYCTTAAQYFHLLRRQSLLLRRAPRPLIMMAVKSLLRHPMAMSRVEELAEGRFQPVLDDDRASRRPDEVRRLIFCSGKVFVDLASSDEYAHADDVAIVRIEQLYPFPEEPIESVLDRYSGADELAWLQEEPQNRGAWAYIAPRLQRLLGDRRVLRYIGHPPQPSPAYGSAALFKVAQRELVRQAFAARPAGAEKGVAHAS